MGLLDAVSNEQSSSQAPEQVEAFKPIIVDTVNVIKELKNVAAANHLKASEIGFKLLKVSTLVSDEKGESAPVDGEGMKLFLDDAYLLNPALKITQHYRVEFYKIDPDSPNLLPFDIQMSANKNLTKVVALIPKTHDITYSSKLEERIIEEINIRKIKSGILVGIRDDNMHKEVKRIVANVRVNGIIDQSHTFVVCQGVDEVQPVNDDLVFHYKKKIESKDAEGKIDYSKRGFVSSVDKDECIIEYIKPQNGTPGRNCRGVFLPVKAPVVKNDTPITISANIVRKENETSVKYIAQRGGYVSIDKGTYDIQDQMEINEISFRSTGSIDATVNSDVKINIKEKDALKDAIGDGLSVEVSELRVQGSVGSGAKIKAKLVEIGGQTHQSALIVADKVQVAVHRGQINGQEVSVDRLEGGSIIADTVHVKQMIGGEIIARQIKIDTLMSNARLSASERIEITDLKGSSNKFTIDPSVTKEFVEQIEETTAKIKKLEEDLKAYPRQLSTKKDLIEKNKPMAAMVKDKIIELKQSGVQPPVTLFAKIKDFQEKVNEYNTFLQTFKDKKEELSEYYDALKAIQTKIFLAKVINHSPWKEYNEVRFHMISPSKDITYVPKEREIAREITLKDVGDGEYRIVRSMEYSGS